MKEANFVAFKLLDDYYREETPNDKAVLEIFPFAKEQPLWAYRAMYDYINLKKTFDIIKFFNEGGALAYKEGIVKEDLAHHASHDEKVSALEIQDIHIQKMNNT